MELADGNLQNPMKKRLRRRKNKPKEPDMFQWYKMGKVSGNMGNDQILWAKNRGTERPFRCLDVKGCHECWKKEDQFLYFYFLCVWKSDKFKSCVFPIWVWETGCDDAERGCIRANLQLQRRRQREGCCFLSSAINSCCSEALLYNTLLYCQNWNFQCTALGCAITSTGRL